MSQADLLLGAVVLLAALTQGLLGFGFGLVLMSVAPRLLGLRQAVPFTAVFGVFVAGAVFWRYRRHARWREVAPMLAGGVLGLPLGVLALERLDPGPCIRALGVLLVLYVLHAAWPRGRRGTGRPVPRPLGVPAGLVAGVFGGAFAMGGPPVIAYANARRLTPATFKGVLQGFFVVASTLQLGLLARAGLLNGAVLRHDLLLAPAVPVGVWLGTRYGDRLHPAVFRRLILSALLVLGALYALRGR